MKRQPALKLANLTFLSALKECPTAIKSIWGLCMKGKSSNILCHWSPIFEWGRKSLWLSEDTVQQMPLSSWSLQLSVTTKQTQENISNSEAMASETMNFDISWQYSRAEIWAWTSKIRRRRRRPPSEMAPRPARALKLSAASIGHRFFSAKFCEYRFNTLHVSKQHRRS
jgi:hypothetical protein